MWDSLGSQYLVFNQWVSFPAVENVETFRFTPGNLQNYLFFRSYALVRMAWDDNGVTNYTPTRRIYPRAGSIVVDFRLPVDIKEAGARVTWHPEVQKLLYRRFLGRSNEPPWTLALEAWQTAPGLAASWTVTSAWETGWSGEITLRNTSAVPITNWTLNFQTDNITETWGADIEGLGEDLFQATPSITTGGGLILPGESFTFGIVGSGAPSLQNLAVVSFDSAT